MNNNVLLTLDDSERWIDYLHQLPPLCQDIYFTPEYYRIYEKYGDGIAKCYVFEKDGNIAIYPFLINSVNDLGYNLEKEYSDIQGAYGYNGVLSSRSDEIFLMDFNDSFMVFWRENSIIAEFTRFHPLIRTDNNSRHFLSVVPDRETVVIDLKKDYLNIRNEEYSSQNRNMISKAKRAGYSVKVLKKPSDNDLEDFIKIYSLSMSKANASGYYLFNRQYFYDLFCLPENNVFLFKVVDKENEPICSSVFLQFGKYFHYHLSGRNKSADNSANNFLLDYAVIFARQNGAEYFHLGGGRSNDINDSLLKFKLNFSKSKTQFSIGKRIHDEEIYNAVVQQWEKRHPEKIEKYRHFLLKYRF